LYSSDAMNSFYSLSKVFYPLEMDADIRW